MIHIQSDFSAESNELYFVKYDFDLFRRYSGFPGLGTISTKWFSKFEIFNIFSAESNELYFVKYDYV